MILSFFLNKLGADKFPQKLEAIFETSPDDSQKFC